MSPAPVTVVLGHIAANVRRSRIRLALTQEAFAEKAKLNSQFYRRIERADPDLNLGLETLLRLAAAASVPVGSLFRASKPVERKVGRPTKRSTARKAKSEG